MDCIAVGVGEKEEEVERYVVRRWTSASSRCLFCLCVDSLSLCCCLSVFVTNVNVRALIEISFFFFKYIF